MLEVADGGHRAGGLVVVDVVALVDGSTVLVVRTRKQVAPADATHQPTVDLDRFDGVERDVVGVVVVVLAQASSRDSESCDVSVEHDFDDVVDADVGLAKTISKGDGLWFGAREPVEDPATCERWSLEILDHHGDGDAVRNEVAAVGERASLDAELGSLANVIAKDGTGLDMGHVEALLEDGTLGAFSASIGPKDEDVHCHGE